MHPRSRCPGCGTQIAGYDNIPIVSWLLLRGRCRHCGDADLAALPGGGADHGARLRGRRAGARLRRRPHHRAALRGGADRAGGHRPRPQAAAEQDRLPARGLGRRSPCSIADRGDTVEHLVAGAGAFLFLLAAALAYPSGMGMGDVKLSGVMGIYLGASVIPALLIAFLTGSVVGVAIIAREGAAGAQEGRPVRHLPGHRRHRRGARRAGADRRLRVEFPGLDAEPSRLRPATLDISRLALRVSSPWPIPLCVRP